MGSTIKRGGKDCRPSWTARYPERSRCAAGAGVCASTPLFVVMPAPARFGIEDEFPGALEEQHGHGQIVAAEARRRLEFLSILVGALQAHLVEGDIAVSALRMILEDR